MGLDLAGDTWVTGVAAVGTGSAGLPPNPCDPCFLGNHAKCVGTYCYRCDPANHPRKPGISGLGDGPQGGTK